MAASIIALAWLVAVVVFGVVEHLVDRASFATVWDGMWWATQTVTTVGYGDLVPDEGVGRLIATVLMIGGLSLFAVITGVITSLFVARAQAEQADERAPGIDERLGKMASELEALRELVARIDERQERPPGPPSRA